MCGRSVMDKFATLEAVACPIDLENIDTDQLIAARFMSRPRAAGYGGYLLHDRRFGAEGKPLGFVLDDPAYAGAKILVTGRNFGVGSSRESAVYALWDYGIRCVVAPGFADIFAANAVKNGLLTAQVEEEAGAALRALLREAPGARVRVDLEARTIVCGAFRADFSIDPVRRMQLLNGWDDLDMTSQHGAAIAAFRARHRAARPWAFLGEKPVAG
jgi:3-isopropylmalate/(R)-2-methylmalate dehydratase small subunit